MADLGDRHDDHDPSRIAALLDRDLDPVERASAEALVESCARCAALHDDLRALADATRVLPSPARSRDFRLTAADAARLSGSPGEPVAASSRLTVEMPDTHATSAHASHDTILVASLVDRSRPAEERQAAEALVATCGRCAALHADLVALSVATRAMPTPVRPRDFSLTPADAARLRPRGWRRWVAAFGTSRDVFSRPLAVGLTTLGLAGLLVTTVPSLFQGSATAILSTVGAPVTGVVPDSATSGPGAAAAGPTARAAAPAPTTGFAAETGAPAAPEVASPVPASDQYLGDLGPVSSPPAKGTAPNAGSQGSGGQTNDVDAAGREGSLVVKADSAIPTAVILSGALLLAGLGLFLMRWAARRTRG